ncbi:MAG: hypothetical protein GX455_08455 [Phycisphaerae bacterium]|nr:hypothetical protein [Phycisphaerae bacterium]
MKPYWIIIIGIFAAFLISSPFAFAAGSDYVVVVSKQTQADPKWSRISDTLCKKHKGAVIAFESNIEEILSQCQQIFPRYICFIARPAEATREFVQQIHQWTRRIDEDPYADCFWGILTGYDSSSALRIAEHAEPLIVSKVAGGTEFAIDKCAEGVWYSELDKGKGVRKEKGGTAEPILGPDDSTEALVKTLTEFKADCFITSGHATERDWQIGYRYRNGSFRCRGGVLYGLDTEGKEYPIQSPNPKVYMAVGNCLMGHIDGSDAMALAFMNSAGINQMIGYTVNSWYGYMGWGCLDYFLEQPGRYTFTEAFFANQAALIHRLTTYFPEKEQTRTDGAEPLRGSIIISPEAKKAGLTANDARGLLYDRDTVAFYGDPAWEARMARADTAWEQILTEHNGSWTFEIKPNLGEKTFEPVNRNGSQRGGRPIIQFFPRRMKNFRLREGAELKPVFCEDFILVPNPRICNQDTRFRVVFSAELF